MFISSNFKARLDILFMLSVSIQGTPVYFLCRDFPPLPSLCVLHCSSTCSLQLLSQLICDFRTLQPQEQGTLPLTSIVDSLQDLQGKQSKESSILLSFPPQWNRSSWPSSPCSFSPWTNLVLCSCISCSSCSSSEYSTVPPRALSLPHVVCPSLPHSPSHRAAVGISSLSAANAAPSWVTCTSHGQTFTLSCQRKKQDEDIGAVCVCAGRVSVLICAASHVHVCVPYGCLCVHILGTHAQPRYRQDLGAWSCSSLRSIELPQKATKDFPGFLPFGKL